MPHPGLVRLATIEALDTWLVDTLQAHESLLSGLPLTGAGIELFNGSEATAFARGGCAILATALHAWLGDQSEIIQFEDSQGPMHVAVRVNNLLFDGYGVSRLDRRMEEVQEYVSISSSLEDFIGGEPPEVIINAFDPRQCSQAGIPQDGSLSTRLLAWLRKADPLPALFSPAAPEFDLPC
jgi:hypothetical protein